MGKVRDANTIPKRVVVFRCELIMMSNPLLERRERGDRLGGWGSVLLGELGIVIFINCTDLGLW